MDAQADGVPEIGGSLPTLDIPLAVVTDSDAAFRFNQDGVYVPRDTAVLVRCEVVDCVHGVVSPDNQAEGTLLVFDFQLDHHKTSRKIHEAVISLVLDPRVKVAKGGLSPNKKIWLDSQLQVLEETNEQHLTGGASYGGGTLEGGVSHSKTAKMDVLKYASVNGWTAYWPRNLHNVEKPHNCAHWSLLENPAKKDGVPAHLRTAVLLERKDSEPFQLQMDIRSKADLRTEVEDFSRLQRRAPMGRLNIDPLDASTSNLKKYDRSNLKEGVEGMYKVSLGTLQKNAFSSD
jgi:hypothetical protein